jgi:ethanolamine permease
MSEKRSGWARYEDVDGAYLENRRLRKSAGWVLLWALGVGAVISGDFFGWQYGLRSGGFQGLLIATLAMAVMYVTMVYSIAELTAALPHAGGFYSFVRSALGPTAGFVCGVTDTIEYVLTPAVIAVGIGSHVIELAATLGWIPAEGIESYRWIGWLAAYSIFVVINVRGVEITMRVGLFITLLAVSALLVFYIGAIATGAFDPALLDNDASGATRSTSDIFRGAFAAVPYAIWFFLAIEQLPLAAEEAHDVARDVPKALIWGIGTLLVLAILTLVLNSGVGGGVAALRDSETPLVDGYRAVFSGGGASSESGASREIAPSLLTLIALTGLIASFHATIYAYGRVLFALSRAGYFPRWISLTGRRRTPWVALCLGGGIGFGAAAILASFDASSTVGAALLNMAVFGAVISYVLVLVSFVVLRLRHPELPRPYRSPFGIPGAVVGAILAIVALGSTLMDETILPGVIGVAVLLALALVYYFAHSRHRLVAQAPEEALALEAEARKELEDPEKRD